MENDVSALESDTPKPIWLDPDNLNLHGQKREHLRELIDFLASHQGEAQHLAECLLGNRNSVDEPAKMMNTLVAQIAAEYTNESTNSVLPILGRVVHHRNQVQDTQLPLPGIPITMPKPVPPFRPRRWARLAMYGVWSQAVLADFVRSSSRARVGKATPNGDSESATDHELWAGRVLSGAVLWGGILCRKNLEELYRSLSRWPEISDFIDEHKRVYMVWFDEAGNCRRWLPDPVTTLTMMDLRPHEVGQVAAVIADQSMDRVVMAYFETILPDPASRPRSVFDFIDSCLLYFELRLPPCLTQYAAGKLPSASPNPVTWARMIRQKVPLLAFHPDQRAEPELQDSEGDVEDELAQPSGDQDEGWATNLRELLGSNDAELRPSDALKSIRERRKNSDLAPEQDLFLAFAADMLAERLEGKLRTVRDMVMALATRLPGVIALEHPKSISPDSFAGAFAMILDDAISPHQHDRFRRYLRTWHRWLVRTDRGQGIDESEVFGTVARAQAVDATLVLEDEYLKARNSLVNSETDFGSDPKGKIELRHIAGLILILGYRCGLRKYEVLKAPLDALLLSDPAEFLVRPWSERGLKTPNAIRKLPLYALLDDEELKLLRAWMMRRREQNGRTKSPSRFLFYSPAIERDFVPEGRIFPAIHEALRKETGDETVHFHTLRKSGAGTFLAFALLQPPNGILPKWLDHWPAQKERIKNFKKWHKRFYANPFATRRHMFAVARTLGHSSPAVSVANYLELQGDLLALWLDTLPINLDSHQIEAIAGVSARRARDIRNAGVRQALWKLIAKRWKNLGIEKAAVVEVNASSSGSLATEQRMSARERFESHAPSELLDVEALLVDVFEGTNKEDLVWRSSYPSSFLDALLQAAQSAAVLTVAKQPSGPENNSSGHVHRFRKLSDLTRSVCPALVQAEQDFEVLTRFAANVFAAIKGKKNRIRFVQIARHWLESRRDERNGLEFSFQEGKLAEQYAEFLLKVGGLPEECSIRYFGDEQSARQWRKFIPRRMWNQFEPAKPGSFSKADANTIGMMLQPNLADTHNDGRRRSSYAWRYLMLMASLWTMAWH